MLLPIGGGASSYKQPTVGAPPKVNKPRVSSSAVGRRRNRSSSNYSAPRVARTVTPTAPVVKPPAPVVKKTVTTARPTGTIVKAAPKAPAGPSMSEADKINQYLRGDTTYMQQQADSTLAGDNFNTQWADQNTNYGSEFALNQSNLNKAKGEADTAMTDDFAARGALGGSGYADAYQNQQTEFDGRQKAMEQAQTQFNTDQGAARTNFGSQQTLTNQKSRADAINRRAAGLAL